ncbi:uncharacterized protein G2W53_041598 [Senna tora]|uniref:Uncharacterized protein n=1 Tax=Senna tora TaxID=362788 RepID=A0A834SK80_9FABA|nr:uncharacterized protein G2W53_041598 [Senna tora]
MSVRVVFLNRSGFDAPIGVVLTWEERGSCLNIFRTTNHGRISETFTNYETKDLLNKSNTSVRVVFRNRSGFDAPIGVVQAWEERGSCLNLFRTTSRGRISETFMNYVAKHLLRKSVDHVLTYSRRKIAVSQKTCCVDHVLAWEERGSCLHALRGKRLVAQSYLRNLHELRGKRLVAQASQTRRFALYLRTVVVLMLQLQSSWHRRSVDHELTYSGQKIVVGSQKPSRTTWKKTFCACQSNTSVRVVFSNRSGFDAPIGVVLAWEERGSVLNIFRKTNRCRVSETFTNYEASESNMSVRVVFANQSGFDVPIGFVLPWEEHGPCLNILRTKNRGRISETFTNCEAKDLLRKDLHELRGKRLVAQVSETRRLALYIRTGVALMVQLESSWHGRSVDHVLTYSGRQIASSSHGRSVDLVLTYSGRQIAVGSQKHSSITRQKICCASESNTTVRVVFAIRSGFDAPIGVVLAWEERRSCLNIFWMTNRGRISETFTNYEAKYLLRK